jgi:hypothetical protein
VSHANVDPQFVEAVGSVLNSVIDGEHPLSLSLPYTTHKALWLMQRVLACSDRPGSGPSDNAFVARLLSLPSESYIGQQMEVLDVVRVHKARLAMQAAIGKTHRKHFERVPRSESRLSLHTLITSLHSALRQVPRTSADRFQR